MTTTLTINRRSRIGFSWSNSPQRCTHRDGSTSLEIYADNEPSTTGHVSRVMEEFAQIAKINRGNDWSYRWFVRRCGEWIPISVDPVDLWLLLDYKPAKKRGYNSFNTIEADVL